MAFNTAGFLFFFLPVSLILYWLTPGKNAKNGLLAALSLLFYAFGGLAQLPVLLLAAVWNYGLGLCLGPERPRRRLWLGLGVAGDLALLGVYKYLGFALSLLGLSRLYQPLGLPLGISFFTFHGISYLLDVYRGRGEPERRFDRLFLYIAFFPRLLAGPIVRWGDAREEICAREVTPEDTASGLRRFVLGLAKKLLLSESAGAVANAVFALETRELGSALAWAGALAYCLQLYFDFSGYSDMAIGLGRCFGFRFPENFRYPYAARSLGEFWRRWHMTLNRWFVDYLYIPLGGSRRGTAVTIRNTLIVFFFTGLWHGAGWTFILWGLWHGLFVSLERLGSKPLRRLDGSNPGRVLLHMYTLLVVVLGFVMFRAQSVEQGLGYLGRMFAFAPGSVLTAEAVLTPGRLTGLCLGALFSLPALPFLRSRLRLGEVWINALVLLGFLLCVLAMAGGGFSPFIYQQF
ncbi:MAG: MBOAT family protein [Oscillospiraceae bacterium]|nr:MBOAT family protein [Oscillospiraceae bacterium]